MSMPVIVRKVWQHNLDEEVSAILRALPDYPFVAMDTSFPGRVFASQILTPYQLMKLNVESTKLIQLGIALCDVNGNLAICDGNDEKCCCCWEFNFRGFDQDIQFYNKESIELLNRQEIDFQKNRDMGIDPSVFRKLISKCDLLHNSQISWFTFDSAYDFGYFIRLLRYKENLPLYIGDFLLLVEDYFGGAVFDIKHMIKYCDGLYGGLERVAKTLGVYRVVGKSHQAGSNSLLTLQTFMKLKQVYFNGRSLDDFKCVIHGLPVTEDINSCFLKYDQNFRPGRDWAYFFPRFKSYGPWKVVAKISPDAYCLDVAPIDAPPIHKVFHVSVLRKWIGVRPPYSLEYHIKPRAVLARGAATLAAGAVDPLGVLSISDTSKGNKKEVSYS